MKKYIPMAAALAVAASGVAFGLSTTASATVNDSYYVVSPSGVAVSANSYGDTSAYCNAGDTLMSGGFQFNNAPTSTVTENNPDWSVGHAPTGWIVQVHNNEAAAHTLYAYAVCLDT